MKETACLFRTPSVKNSQFVAHKNIIMLWDEKNYKYKNLGRTTDARSQVGPKDMGRGISRVKGEKRNKNPCLCRTTSVLSSPKSDVTS